MSITTQKLKLQRGDDILLNLEFESQFRDELFNKKRAKKGPQKKVNHVIRILDENGREIGKLEQFYSNMLFPLIDQGFIIV
jgi:hypothetical protein